MELSLVVAMAKNGVIGRAGGLPWRLSTDMKRFKAITMGKPVVMGRKTWESIGKPLPGRFNIVISRDPAYPAEGAAVAGSLDEAIRTAQGQGAGDEICVIGGGEVYRQALPRATRLHVTHVEAEIEGDTYFPEIDDDAWKVVTRESVPAGEKDVYPTQYLIYERRQSG
ncbi:dihydrofolate reductase [Chelativorans sp. AA-79]|uniref:dihydrofolate reductase n=1 Tax=Chelativorans sp. AA-79 TaxID=3028735 RepID=UPI0023FA0C2F|nr:dihydrofolate reductase [Chelativorans sp. AA-79]WEX11380.1 dihydrofolate reductase [Chelativorans sp. AA-79]